MDKVRKRLLERGLSRAFSPSSPVTEEVLFSGRRQQLRNIVDSVNSVGQHLIIYGERGVGKTSLANVLTEHFVRGDEPLIKPITTCSRSDTFGTVWEHLFEGLVYPSPLPGFTDRTEGLPVSTVTDGTLSVDDVRRALTGMPHSILIIDEFDRLSNENGAELFADLIKVLSDRRILATIVIVGVADDVAGLISSHQSIERCITQIHLPKMTIPELEEVVVSRYDALGMEYEDNVPGRIAWLSQGFPHYTHSLGLWAGRNALDSDRERITTGDVGVAIVKAVDNTAASIKDAYQKAISSSRTEARFSDVLLACALVEQDQFGFFSARDVKLPYSKIRGAEFDIPAYSAHLAAFCGDERGNILQRRGRPRSYLYRFTNPLMKTFITLLGHQPGTNGNSGS